MQHPEAVTSARPTVLQMGIILEALQKRISPLLDEKVKNLVVYKLHRLWCV